MSVKKGIVLASAVAAAMALGGCANNNQQHEGYADGPYTSHSAHHTGKLGGNSCKGKSSCSGKNKCS